MTWSLTAPLGHSDHFMSDTERYMTVNRQGELVTDIRDQSNRLRHQNVLARKAKVQGEVVGMVERREDERQRKQDRRLGTIAKDRGLYLQVSCIDSAERKGNAVGGNKSCYTGMMGS